MTDIDIGKLMGLVSWKLSTKLLVLYFIVLADNMYLFGFTRVWGIHCLLYISVICRTWGKMGVLEANWPTRRRLATLA